MLNHHINLNNEYEILTEDGQVVFTVKITDKPGNQIIIETDTEVFSGPIQLLNLSGIEPHI